LLVIRAKRDPAMSFVYGGSQDFRRGSPADDLRVVYGAIPRDDKEIAILTRSILEVIVDLSTDIEVPASDVQERGCRLRSRRRARVRNSAL